MNKKVIVSDVNYPEEVRQGVQYYARQKMPDSISRGARWKIGRDSLNRHIAVIMEYGNGELTDSQQEHVDNTRRLVLGWLTTDPDEIFVPVSSSDLTPQELTGVSRWMSENKHGVYRLRPAFREELRWLIVRANEDLRRTVDAMKRGEDLTFGDCLERWKTESPFSSEPENNGAITVQNIADVYDGFVTDENIERFRKKDRKPKTVVETDQDPLKEYFG